MEDEKVSFVNFIQLENKLIHCQYNVKRKLKMYSSNITNK